ncbi:MAG: RNB domain-containing ribonuclease [Parachlamydiaceae bacterium]
MNGYELLGEIARKAMVQKGLTPNFSSSVLQQLETITQPAPFEHENMKDLRSLLWCSIDNDDSRDLDQLTTAYQLPSGDYRLLVAIADVDTLVAKSSPIDQHAQINTTSVYTPAKIFPMLPEKLSTDLTSLNEDQDRVSMIFEMHLNQTMDVFHSELYTAIVKNHAKLTYSGVGAWLEGRQPIPGKIPLIPGLEQALILQDQLAQAIKQKRQLIGALTFETRELYVQFKNGKPVDLIPTERNRAHELIENLMISANTASAKYAIRQQIPSLRRVVRVPARWERIVEIAASFRETLPLEPDSVALDAFLKTRKEKNPDTYPELSLTIIKLLGSGEYVVESPGDSPIGHFGLALRDYTHSTAPNRRYPDLITQRLLKASLNQQKTPYTLSELENLAEHCTQCEDATSKVERQVKKSAAAMVLAPRIGETFQSIVTGVSDKGTWVRLQHPPVEGKLLKGAQNLDVGDQIAVKLINVNVMEGFIDFMQA